MTNYISWFSANVIIYPCHQHNTASKRRPWTGSDFFIHCAKENAFSSAQLNLSYISISLHFTQIAMVIMQQNFLETRGALLTWISNHIYSKVWYEITYFIPKLQRWNHWSLGMHKKFHTTLYNGFDYLSMLGLRWIHVIKMGPRVKLKIHIMTIPTTTIFIGWQELMADMIAMKSGIMLSCSQE